MDLLHSGTPVITLIGETLASRIGASLLYALGCPELVATSFAQYEELAVHFGRDRAAREALQRKVRQQRDTAPLFDVRMSVTNLERAYTEMVRRWRLGQPPAPFSLERRGTRQTPQTHQAMRMPTPSAERTAAPTSAA